MSATLTQQLRWSAALVALSTSTLAAQGPTGRYYLTAGDQHNNAAVQGLTATLSPQANSLTRGGEYAIAVAGDVRTLASIAGGGLLGSQYTLGLAYTGTSYAYPSGVGAFYDGTTDGTLKYAVNFFTGATTVYAMQRDWSSPVALFSTTANSGALGITYDPSNNSLWVGDFLGTSVVNYSLSGSVLSSFTVGLNFGTSLAMDYTDGTLWMGSQNALGTFYQYSRSGTLLQTQSYANLADQNTLGGEFAFGGMATVPEPATLALVAGGLAVLGVAARRRRQTPG